MGIRKERLRRKTASGTYDTIHLETSADIVLLSDGSGLLEDELLKVKSIEKGGTGSTTADEAMWSLINGCETLDTAEAGDWFFVLDTDAQTVKKISLEELKKFSSGSGGSEEPDEPVTNPNWPDKSQLTLGNTISWAGHDWIVSHIVVTDQDVSNVKAVEAYLTLSDLLGRYTWNYLQDACTTFANSSLTEAQRGCLKSVTAGNTSGKVFVATYGQMDGGFSYFNSNSRRRLRSIYWTSSECDEVDAWRVDSFGSCNYTDKSTSYGFRPSVCVDLTLYDSGNSGGSDVPTKDDFTVGETISFAGKQWIVAHITDTEVYLAYPTTISTGTWLNLQDPCMEFSNELTGEDKEHLKYIQTERTSGIVFIPSVGQLSYSGSPMDTYGFEYFNCDSRRAIGERYWTSTEYTQSSADNLAYFIDDDGSIQADLYNTNQFDELGIRPFVCIDLTSYT